MQMKESGLKTKIDVNMYMFKKKKNCYQSCNFHWICPQSFGTVYQRLKKDKVPDRIM